MNVISRRKLVAFYRSKVQYSRHSQAFDDWFKLTRKAKWRNFSDAKATFGRTDATSDTTSGKTATIFDVGGNKYRIVALIDYTRQTVLVTHVMTHKEYDKANWKNDL